MLPPVARREFKSALGTPALWVLTAWLCLMVYMRGPHDALRLCGLAAFLAGLGAALGAYRALKTEREQGTLPFLATLPIPARRLLLQLCLGGSLAYVLCAFLPCLLSLALWPSRFSVATQGMFLCLPLAVPLGAMIGGVLAQASEMVWWKRIYASTFIVALTAAAISVVDQVVEFGVERTVTVSMGLPSELVGPVLVTAILATAALAWTLVQGLISVLGGAWPASEGGSVDVGAFLEVGAGAHRGESIPDAGSPLLWREIRSDRWLIRALVVFGLVAQSQTLSHSRSQSIQWSGITDVSLFAGIGLVCVLAAVRTSRDRTSGLWADLALTPLPRHSIVVSRFIGLVFQFAIALAPLLVFEVVWFRGQALDVLAARLPMFAVAAGWAPVAILAGIYSGCEANGLKAAFGALAMLFVGSWFAAIPPSILVAVAIPPGLAAMLVFVAAYALYVYALWRSSLKRIALAQAASL